MDLPRVTSDTSLAIGIAQGLERLFPHAPTKEWRFAAAIAPPTKEWRFAPPTKEWRFVAAIANPAVRRISLDRISLRVGMDGG